MDISTDFLPLPLAPPPLPLPAVFKYLYTVYIFVFLLLHTIHTTPQGQIQGTEEPCVIVHPSSTSSLRSLHCNSSNSLTSFPGILLTIHSLQLTCRSELTGPEAGQLGQHIHSKLNSLTELRVHKCGQHSLQMIQWLDAPLLNSLNMSGNGLDSVDWHLIDGFRLRTMDLRDNPLSCEKCANEWLIGQKQEEGDHQWDLHTIFPELPAQLYVDNKSRTKSKACTFEHCSSEEVAFEQPVVNSRLGSSVELKCKLNAEPTGSRTKQLPSPFVWPLRQELGDEERNGIAGNGSRYLVNRTDGLATLQVHLLTSDELGFVACRCFECRTPRFAVAELRFDVNVTARIEGNSNGSDTQLIMHGYPLHSASARIVRLEDNVTETHQLNDHITAFFNESFFVKYQREHSYFFLKYFSVYIHECVECVHHQTSGHYTIQICLSTGCIQLSHYFGTHYPKVPDNTPSAPSSTYAYSLLVFLFVFALFTGLSFVSGLASWKIRRKILRHGWEVKRRRTSRNTERTEETSVPLDTISHSASSCSYMTQHVPVIDNKYIQLKEKIGKGAFGEVYTAEWIQSDEENAKGEKVAVKMLHNVTLDAEMDKEAALLAKLDHANVLKLYGVCHWHAQITLVLELMNQGDLKSYLKNRMPRCDNYSQFPPALLQTELINICTQIATGLCYVASQQIVHRDLAARNCLVSGESDLKFCSAAFRPPITVKISDFGMSRRLYSDTEYYRMHDKRTALPVRWLPPECLSSGKFTQLSDMWSFGVTLFEVFTYGDVPFGNLSNNEVLSAVVSGLRPEIPTNCPLAIGEIMSACWKENPLKRICAEEALTRLKLIQ